MANNYYDGFEHKYFTTSDGVKLHYVVKGSGKPIIMLHGLSASYANYCVLAPLLSSQYQVYVLDMRCHGLSDQPEYGLRISRFAKDVYEFQQYLGLKKASWMGHSMGNAVIWSMIDLFGQEHIDTLTLIDQNQLLWANPQDTEAQIREYGGLRFDVWQVYNAYQISLEEGIASLYHYYPMGEKPDDPDIWNYLATFDLPPAPHKQIGKLFMNHIVNDWADVIERISVPTLYVGGGKSYATTPECQKWIVDHIPGCRYLDCAKGTHSGLSIQFAGPIAEEVKKLIG